MYLKNKEKKEIEFESRKIGSLKEFVSKNGKHCFKGNLMFNGHSLEVIGFENGDKPKRFLYLMLTSNQINY